jgi:DNA-binding transcriptional LysR family regulator
MGRPSVQRYKELRPAQLRSFCACVRFKTFSAAARELGISQPALWHQVRALERQFGATLLLRQGRHWELSEDGSLLYELAGSIVASMDSLQQVFTERQREMPRTLVVAGAPTVILEELARPVSDFSQRHPQDHIALMPCLVAQMIDLVMTGEADVGIELLGNLPTRQVQFSTEPFCQRQWALVSSKHHPLARKRRLTPADVVRYPFILDGKEFHWRKRVDEMLQQAGLLDQLHVALEIRSTLAARRYVSQGMGITIVPMPHDHVPFRDECIRPLKGWFPPEQVVVVWRRGATPRPHARIFIDFARQLLAEA